MALYCYFEALGVGFSDRDAEDVTPWLIANSTVLMHLTFSGALSLTLLADSRTSISAVLRGLAPLRVTVALTVVFITSLIPLLIIFAGREHGTRQQQQLYRTANTSFLLLWVVIISILAAPPYNSTAQQVQSGCSVEDDEGGLTCRQRHVLSFSAASGGGVVTAGI